jgi:hypothetical protein
LINIVGEQLKDESGAPLTITFRQFLLGRLVDPAFAKDMTAVLSAVQIKEAVEKSNGVIALESADWERLRDATKAPQGGGYNPTVAHCLAGYMRAIVDAGEKPQTPAAEQAGEPAPRKPVEEVLEEQRGARRKKRPE